MALKIFISYRRDDSAPWAGRLYERLARTFKKSQLFMDVDHIAPGQDFVRVLEDQVGRCDVLLAIIGRAWLESRNERGERRLDDANDFVRLEIETALRRGITVIPILVDGAPMPRAAELPESLHGLLRKQARTLSHAGFGLETQALLQALGQPSAGSSGDGASRAQSVSRAVLWSAAAVAAIAGWGTLWMGLGGEPVMTTAFTIWIIACLVLFAVFHRRLSGPQAFALWLAASLGVVTITAALMKDAGTGSAAERIALGAGLSVILGAALQTLWQRGR